MACTLRSPGTGGLEKDRFALLTVASLKDGFSLLSKKEQQALLRLGAADPDEGGVELCVFEEHDFPAFVAAHKPFR